MRIGRFLLLLVVISGCNINKGNDSFYKLLNNGYKELLLEEGFSLQIFESPLNIGYYEEDTMIFDSITFYIPNYGNNLLDTTYSWNQDSLDENFKFISKAQYVLAKTKDVNYFRKEFIDGFALISKPGYSQDKNFLLFKEIKILNFESRENSFKERFLIFQKNNKNWIFFKEYEQYTN